MYSSKYRRFLFLSLCFLTISCVSVDYYGNYWYRNNKRSTYFKKKYEPIDNIKINSLILCKREENINRRFKTEGILNIRTNDIEKNIVEELKKQFNKVDYNIKEDTLTKYNCGFLNKKNILSGIYKPHFKTTDSYSVDITFEIVFKSYRDHYQDGFYGGSADLLDHDKHDIQFIIRIAIFHADELIYFDNYEHFTERKSEIDKNVEYQMPQGIVNTLVDKSLIEYHKRLE